MKNAALLLTGALIGGAVVFAATLPQQPSAYDICTEARAEYNGASEEACGDALDREQSVFLCNKAGDICWTERI